jgi:cyanophycinase
MTTLVAIGGAINPKNPVVLREFVRRAGGIAAHIAILPQASALADTGEFYEKTFRELGAHAASLGFSRREEADDPERLAVLRDSSGVFIAGGNQVRLSALIGGTQFEQELHAACQSGAVTGGTSAGAAILSQVMIAYGKGGATPREGQAQFLSGFGFTRKVLFDQHFRQRDRQGRLIYAVAAHPGLLGVGVDEDTAAILEDDSLLTVCGSGSVTVVDGSEISASDVAEIEKKGPVAVANLRIHILTHGCQYDMVTRRASIQPKTILSE